MRCFSAPSATPASPTMCRCGGLLIPLRRSFQQYINLRPVRLLAGVDSPLKGRAPGDIDFYVVRENNEGEYSAIGGRLYEAPNTRWRCSRRSSRAAAATG